jgi:hypothetical protein
MSPNCPAEKKLIKTMKRKPPDKQLTSVTPKGKTRKIRVDLSLLNDQIEEPTTSPESSPSAFQCVSPDSADYTESNHLNKSIVKVRDIIIVFLSF